MPAEHEAIKSGHQAPLCGSPRSFGGTNARGETHSRAHRSPPVRPSSSSCHAAATSAQDDGDEGPQRSVMVGHAAAACFDEMARMNDKNYATDRQHAGGKKNTGLAIAEASVAAVRARIAERERLAEQERVANAVSSDESDEDEEDEEDSEPPEASDEESDGEPPEASDEESGEEEAAEHAKKKQRQE